MFLQALGGGGVAATVLAGRALVGGAGVDHTACLALDG